MFCYIAKQLSLINYNDQFLNHNKYVINSWLVKVSYDINSTKIWACVFFLFFLNYSVEIQSSSLLAGWLTRTNKIHFPHQK
jgi:hypothetical protein